MKIVLDGILQKRYKIKKQLQQSNLTASYLAEDRYGLADSYCIVKQYYSQTNGLVLKDPAWQNLYHLLTVEVINLKQLDKHPQIPEIIDYFTLDRDFYLVREFVNGQTLEEEIKNNVFSESEVILFLEDILDVLDLIHKLDNIHLNLKPSNIIRSKTNYDFLVTDFGKISQIIGSVTSRFLPNPTRIINQKGYISPEQIRGYPTFASDIYSLGTIVLYCLTGKDPRDVRLMNLDNYARSSIIDVHTSKSISISSKLANILSKMIAENPLDRYRSSKDILQDLAQKEKVVLLPPPFATESFPLPIEPKKEIPQDNSSSHNFVYNKKKQKKKKGINIWLLLLIPFIAALFTLKLGINKNKYRNFLQYTNINHNFSIKYPNNWSVKEIDNYNSNDIVAFYSPKNGDRDNFREKVYLSVADLPPGIDNLDRYTQILIDRITPKDSEESTIYREISGKVDGNLTKTIIYPKPQGNMYLQEMKTFTIKNDRVYIITYIAERVQYDRFIKTVNKMIQSLDI